MDILNDANSDDSLQAFEDIVDELDDKLADLVQKVDLLFRLNRTICEYLILNDSSFEIHLEQFNAEFSKELK